MQREVGEPNRPAQLTASQWRHIVNGATDTANISTDKHCCVTSWNVGASRTLGWAEHEMLGRDLEHLFTPEDHARGVLNREIEDARRSGRGGGEEGRRVRKDGTRFWAAGELAPIRSDQGDVVGFVKIIRDRTLARQAEEAIREERAALKILNRTWLGSCGRDRPPAAGSDRDRCWR